jgi:hypothetical protein
VRRQQVALAAEVKTVLDSWVRFEQQEKENEQARLVKTIVDNVLKNISEEKTQRDVLAWAVSEVDRECPSPPFLLIVDDWWWRRCRASQEQGDLGLGRTCVGRWMKISR